MTGTDSPLPAILGGTTAVTADHTEANRWPLLSEEDEQAVLRVMRDGNLSFHPEVQALEADYAGLTGRRYALAHNNGTAALLAAFLHSTCSPVTRCWCRVRPGGPRYCRCCGWDWYRYSVTARKNA